ncbi:MAG TPA: AAA family ATPase [Planctomycetaceae bacterium]|jgi:type II secretory pathway predicted ATPase ExeA|nr:AAA family ATPase [Planctomycetaceae bacterium]
MSADGGARGAAPLAPFETRLDFFAGASHHEALARLEYLVETGLRCGVVIGPKGAGKTTALRTFVEQSSIAHWTKIHVDLRALGAAEALKRLGQGLGITSHARGRLSLLWQEVTDAFLGHRQAKRPCVVIFDHLDRALPDCQQAVERLLSRDADPGAATFVLAFSGHSFPVVAKQWRQAADLRIEVAPLTAEETAAFVKRVLSALDLPNDAFDAAASEILFRLTGGVPRDIVRLCELSLLSAMQDDKRSISADVVEAAMRELSLLRFSA